VDYYFKLCTDKPVISYLEDPVPPGDLAGWAKLTAKFTGSKVRLGSRKVYADEDSIRKYAFPVDKQAMPAATEEEIADLNSKRVVLNCGQFRPF
jgi:enolase